MDLLVMLLVLFVFGFSVGYLYRRWLTKEVDVTASYRPEVIQTHSIEYDEIKGWNSNIPPSSTWGTQ